MAASTESLANNICRAGIKVVPGSIPNPRPVPAPHPLIYTEQQLTTLRKKELAQVGKDIGVPNPQQNKSSQIAAILAFQAISPLQIDLFKSSFSSSSCKENGPHHDLYRDQFNSIDLHDQCWYKLQGNYKVRNWRAKFILSILEVGLVNSYALYTCYHPRTEFMDFVPLVCTQLASGQ